MNHIARRLMATIMLVCALMSYIAPAAVAAGTSSETVVYDFHLQDDKNKVLDGYFITNYGTDFRLSQILEDVEGFYADGSLNWKYAGASADLRGTSAEEENLPVGVRFDKSYGTRIYSGEGSWLAYTIKSPGAGTYTLSLNYAMSYNNGIVATYILPADTEDIIGATDPSNRVGISDMCDGTGTRYNDGNRDSNKVYQGYDAYVGTWDFEAGKEYIVVFEVYKGSAFNGHGQMHLFGLEMTPGTVASSQYDQNDSGDKIGTHLVKDNVITVADAGAMASVWEVNGQDYYFLPIEGGRLLVFNLDTWELIDSVDSGISYPTSTAVLQKDDGTVEVYVGGNGTKLFYYNPYTKESGSTVQYNYTSGLEGESALRGIYAYEGKVYIGLNPNGHLAAYDPVTKSYEDFGDMVVGSAETEEGEEGEESDETGGIAAITCYGGYLYMTAGSGSGYKLIKFDLSTKKVVTEWDVTSILGPCSSYRGLAVLGNGDYLLSGGAGFAGLAMVNLSTNKLVTDAEAKAMGLSDKALGSGALGMATEPLDGKQYFTTSDGLYEYDHITKNFSYVGPATNAFVTSGKQWVTMKVDEKTQTLSETAQTQLYLFTIAGGGQVRLYNPSESSAYRGKKLFLNGLMKPEYGTNGASMRINTVAENGDNTKLYLGAFNTPLSAEYNVLTGDFTYYRTSGQTDSQIWYDGKLYAGNYSACVVYEIDMSNSDNNTPRIANMKNYEQKRIHTLAAGDGYIFAGTIPTTYINGGGIGIYNTVTGEEDFIRFKETSVNGEKVVSNSELWDLSVKSLVYSDGLLYGATSRAGGSASTYVDGTSAQIFVYDYRNGVILDTLDLRDYISDYLPSGEIDFIGGIAADPMVEGRFWGSVSDVIFTFSYDRSSGKWDVQLVYDYEHTEYVISGGRANWNLPITFDTVNNAAYVSLSNAGVIRVSADNWNTLSNISAEIAVTVSPMFMEFGADNNLYYGSGADLRMFPLNLTDAEWNQAKAWDAAVAALDVNSATYVTEVQALRTSYEALPDRVKVLVQDMILFEEAEAELLELLITAETGSLTADSVDVLEEYLVQYDNMTARQQRYVKNYTVLTESYDTAVELRENEAVAAETVQAQIDGLDVTSLPDAEAVVAVREAYEALNDRQKALVDTTKLLAAEKLLADYENAVKNVQAQIDALPDKVTSTSQKTEITAARTAYDALTDEQKEMVDATKLISAETQLADVRAANGVQSQIDALPETVTLANKYAIRTARNNYNALSDYAKALVESEKLDAAEAQFAALKAETPTAQFYDFELYYNLDFKEDVTTMTWDETKGRFTENFEGHRYYNGASLTAGTNTIASWFYDHYVDTINWGTETSAGTNSTVKDYQWRGANAQGLRMAATSAGKYSTLRIRIPAAGLYTLSLTAGNTPSTFDLYIFEAATDYATALMTKDTIAAAMVADNQLVDNYSMTAEQAATLGQWNFSEAGDYIVVFKAEATLSNGISMRNMALTPVVNEDTAVAKVGEEYFLSMEDAFAFQIENGAEAVSLFKDVALGDLVLESGAVLDLNGNVLTVDSVLTYASSGIIDSSEKDTGVLVIKDAAGNMLSSDNAQLPIYDAAVAGLRFFEVSVKSVATTGKGGADPKYWFQVSAVNFDEIHKLIQAGSELDITVKMTWNDGEANAIASVDFLNKWADAFSNNESIYITVSAVNTEGLENFSLTPCMAANGVAVQGEQM